MEGELLSRPIQLTFLPPRSEESQCLGKSIKPEQKCAVLPPGSKYLQLSEGESLFSVSKSKGISFPEVPHLLLNQHKPSASPAPCGREFPKQSPVPPKPAFYRLHVTPQLL